jgi:hypothetical protein
MGTSEDTGTPPTSKSQPFFPRYPKLFLCSYVGQTRVITQNARGGQKMSMNPDVSKDTLARLTS